MHAAVGQAAGSLTDRVGRGQHRLIEATFDPIRDPAVVLDGLDQVGRLGGRGDVDVGLRRSTSSNTRCSGSAKDVAVYSIRADSGPAPQSHSRASRGARRVASIRTAASVPTAARAGRP